MCGDDFKPEDVSQEGWDGFLEERIVAPRCGPLPSDWPSSQEFATLLKAAGTKWDAHGLQPPSIGGYLLPPNYGVGNETVQEGLERLASDYRKQLRDLTLRHQPHLASRAQDDLKSFLSTGQSNGMTMKLTAFLLKPNQLFGLHVHPTMEMELTLRGALGEVRLVGVDEDKPLEIPYRGPWPHHPQRDAMIGPNLNDIASTPYAPLVSKAAWKKTESVSAGKYLFNEVGSIHKSYTEHEPFAGLALWGCIHAKIDTSEEGDAFRNSELLQIQLGDM